MCLESIGCFHRDLKPANILMNKNNNKWNYYIADFGISKIDI